MAHGRLSVTGVISTNTVRSRLASDTNHLTNLVGEVFGKLRRFPDASKPPVSQILPTIDSLPSSRLTPRTRTRTGSSVVIVFGRPFVKRFALCYQTVVLSVLSVLSIMLVYCCQTIGRIKMNLGMQVGLGPGHIVLDRDPAPPPTGAQPPVFGPCLLWTNGRPSQLLVSTCL